MTAMAFTVEGMVALTDAPTQGAVAVCEVSPLLTAVTELDLQTSGALGGF